MGASALKHFDESLEANEYGIALAAPCDFLDVQTGSLDAGLLVRIETLCAKTGAENECLTRLRQKAHLNL